MRMITLTCVKKRNYNVIEVQLRIDIHAEERKKSARSSGIEAIVLLLLYRVKFRSKVELFLTLFAGRDRTMSDVHHLFLRRRQAPTGPIHHAPELWLECSQRSLYHTVHNRCDVRSFSRHQQILT